MKADVLISGLKKSIDALCERYTDEALIQSLEYAKRPYGLMQYEELREILGLLDKLKGHIDDLSDARPPAQECWQEEVYSESV